MLDKKRIIFPEIEDSRLWQAFSVLQKDKNVEIVLLGEPENYTKIAKKYAVDLAKINFVDVSNSRDELAERYFELRKHKGLTLEEAEKLIKDPLVASALLLDLDYADALVAGALYKSAEVLRVSFQLFKHPRKKASSYFLLEKKSEKLLLADCTVNIEPSAEELAEIALDTAGAAAKFNLEPSVAMLSFSTLSSAHCPKAQKVAEAVRIAKNISPNLSIVGEVQADAVFDLQVAAQKGINLQQKPNVLVFPNLEAGNIAYKLLERLGGYKATGAFIQGIKKPVVDLSRGCEGDDVVRAVRLV